MDENSSALSLSQRLAVLFFLVAGKMPVSLSFKGYDIFFQSFYSLCANWDTGRNPAGR
ncbi:hypothetical protein [Pseudomonas fluorescens]|uniref:hypothetical protein n=1 Tax=Pseudomonas fluorescens TaxID=294 RepID=UPI00177E9720|nr:hypothetical protein [Pseudomonas fluorescens]